MQPTQVSVSTRTEASAQKYRDQGLSAYALETEPLANSRAAAAADLVLVAVKPGYVVSTLTEIANSVSPSALVISVAAGITTESMETALGNSIAVIRAMPNTPAIVSRAVTGIAAGKLASAEQISLATELFESVGKCLVLDEAKIDALSTVSGSGPAYVFYLIEELTKTAEQLGFNQDEAELLVQETFLGASLLLEASGKTPAELRQQVTSPNGTTMRAIAELEKADLTELFNRATEAALLRAKEIARGQ